MKVAIGADHGGFDAKEKLVTYLKNKGYAVADMGTNSSESVDYPDFAEKVCQEILQQKADFGVLICGTGIGISIAANRHVGIRAALLYNDETAALARQHNNANIAVFGGRMMSVENMEKRLDIFLNTGFEGGRHLRRIEKIDVYGGCSNVGL